MSAFYDLASLVVVPSGYKSGKIYAQKPLTTDGQLTFSRASTATRVNSAGLIETVSSNVPRLDYLNSSCPRLLLEPQRTNSVQYSEQADNAYWLKFQCSITANQAVSPDGYQNADLFTSTANGGSVIYRTGIAAGALSFFAKVASLNANTLFAISVDGVGAASWNQDGTLNAVTGGTATDGISYGNGWYRFNYNVTSGSVVNYGLSGSTSGDTAYVWGFQNEASATYPTSYVNTLGAAVTRGADFSQKSSISGLYGATATTFFLDFVKKENATGWIITGGNGTQLYSLLQFDTTAGIPRIVFDNALDTSSTLSPISNGRHKFAISYAANDIRIYLDGALILTDTAGSYYQWDRIGVNATAWTGFTNNTNAFELNQFLMIPAASTNAQLAELTTL